MTTTSTTTTKTNNRQQSQLFFNPLLPTSSMYFSNNNNNNNNTNMSNVISDQQHQQLLDSIIHSVPFEQRIRSLSGITSNSNKNTKNTNSTTTTSLILHHDPLRRNRNDTSAEDNFLNGAGNSKFRSIADVVTNSQDPNNNNDENNTNDFDNFDNHQNNNQDDEEEVEKIRIDINPTELKNKSNNNSNSNNENNKNSENDSSTTPTARVNTNSGLKFKPFRKIASEGGTYGNTTAVAVDYSNKWFATGSSDGAVRAYDLVEGKQRVAFQSRHIGAVRSIAISPLSPYMFSAGEDKLIKCWDLERNEIVREYQGHLSAVYTVATHPRQDIIISGGRDATVRVWDIRTRNPVHILTGSNTSGGAGHTDSVLSLATQDSTPQLASGGADGLIYLWDIGSGRPITRLTRHKKAVRSLMLHPTENTMVSVGADAIRKWRVPIGEFMGNLSGSKCLQNLSESNNNNNDNKNNNNNATNSSSALQMDTVWNAASYSRLHDSFVVGSENGTLLFCDWSSMKVFYETKTKTKTKSAASTASGGGDVISTAVLCASFDVSGDYLITGEGDKTITQWKSKIKGGGGDGKDDE